MSLFSIQNIVKETDAIQKMMALPDVAQATQTGSGYLALSAKVHEKIRSTAAAVDKVLSQKGRTAADLAIRSRRAYQWLKFLEDPENLTTHLEALQRIHLFLPALNVLPKYRKFGIDFSFYHTSALFQIQGKGSRIQVTAQECLATSPDSVLIALLDTALGKPNQTTRDKIREYTFSPAYQTAREYLEYLGVPRGSFTKGAAHDLAESFDRVNRAYYDNQISPPHLVWNNKATFRKFGHYQWDTDTVMVSRALDQNKVPDYVVDFVMYHELLHKKLGARLVNSRRMVHTSKFREQEARFIRLKDAQDYLNRLSRKRK